MRAGQKFLSFLRNRAHTFLYVNKGCGHYIMAGNFLRIEHKYGLVAGEGKILRSHERFRLRRQPAPIVSRLSRRRAVQGHYRPPIESSRRVRRRRGQAFGIAGMLDVGRHSVKSFKGAVPKMAKIAYWPGRPERVYMDILKPIVSRDHRSDALR